MTGCRGNTAFGGTAFWGLPPILLFSALLFSAGCVNQQLHETLLLQENRQLEHRLLVTQAQADDLRRENESLRNRSFQDSKPDSDIRIIPPEIPEVILPDQPSGRPTPSGSPTPDAPAGLQPPPVWNPSR